jgi:DNA repair protein RadC
VLRRECRFEAPSDALVLLRSLSREGQRGSATLVLLDEDRRLVDLFVVEGGDSQLRHITELVCQADMPDVTDMLIVSDRTGEAPADRPDDELTWMELVDLAESWDITLLDWFVVTGRYSFSVAQFAPIPAQW